LDHLDHRRKIGIALAVWMFTLQKPSSEIVERGFPALCECCGRRAIVPIGKGTIVGEHELRLAMQCWVCGSRPFARAANMLLAVRRKVDRRAVERNA
jgi:hypothetical protein